jgi:integrase/recombinase XerC
VSQASDPAEPPAAPQRDAELPAAPEREAELPAALRRIQAEFGRHLAAERGLSGHTVRAYLGDVRSLLEHAAACGITEPGELDVAVLRSWLARQRSLGQARASLAR